MVNPILRMPPPPPMRDVARAQPMLQELREAAERAAKAWNRSQLEDALRSVRHFADEAEAAARGAGHA